MMYCIFNIDQRIIEMVLYVVLQGFSSANDSYHHRYQVHIQLSAL